MPKYWQVLRINFFQTSLHADIINNKLSVREAEDLVKKL